MVGRILICIPIYVWIYLCIPIYVFLLEDLLLCESLPTRTTGVEMFGFLNSFFEENKTPWENWVDIYTDGNKIPQHRLDAESNTW